MTLLALSGESKKRIMIYGTGELAELAHLCIRDVGLTCVGFVNGQQPHTFLSYPVCEPEDLPGLDFDALLVAELTDVERVNEALARIGVPATKIVQLGQRL